jgi:hypothetical protein
MTASGDELRAAVQARKELGPDYEDALVESFLEKMDQEIDRRVADRLAQQRSAAAVPHSAGGGQRLALAIVSLVLGVMGTVGALAAETPVAVLVIWLGIAAVNLVFVAGSRERPPLRGAAPPPDRWPGGQ